MYTVRPITQVAARGRLFAAIFIVTISTLAFGLPGQSHAACAVPTTDYGSETSSLTISASATYNIWTRMYVPSSSASTFAMQVDGSNCYIVGGASVPTNTWTWIDYQKMIFRAMKSTVTPAARKLGVRYQICTPAVSG